VHQVEIDCLFADTPVDPRAHLDASKVGRYAAILDQLPPVVVFKTERGLLLVDGYHRVAAAQALGRTTVAADVTVGSRSDALRYAIARASAEREMTEDEAAAAIARRSKG